LSKKVQRMESDEINVIDLITYSIALQWILRIMDYFVNEINGKMKKHDFS